MTGASDSRASRRALPRGGARFVIWGLAAIAAAAGCRKRSTAGPTDAAPPAASVAAGAARSLELPPPELPAEAKRIGERAEARDYVLVVREVRECPAPAAFPGRPGTVRLGLRLELEATGRGDIPVNPFHANVVDGAAERYPASFGGCTPELRAEQLAPGARAAGFVHFDLPHGATDLTLEYAPFVLGAGRQALRVRLDR
ncbi:MAG: DUF4352 domain-containing protein [Polyangiaceae bacterium]|nr:DUF4352 domain-containing protein [Polyangiaceae bacterium]